jgi:phage regulator Rha-like protein
MSSLEIAELTGKSHDHVLRNIRNMLEQLGLVPTSFGGYYTASNGKRNPCYHLPQDETITLVAGYDAALRFGFAFRSRDRRSRVHTDQ